MATKDGDLLGILEGVLNKLPFTTEKDRLRFTKETHRRFEVAMDTPPKIAVIGKTGVGKSSTINALFGTNLPVSHTEACTREEEAISYHGELLEGAAGDVVIYDMPGLGEDIETDEIHKQVYRRVIAECDVAVWLLAAGGTGRAMAYDQLMLRDVVMPANRDVASRLVVGVNQVDCIEPGSWDEEVNQPSRTQKQSIVRRVSDIKIKLITAVPTLTDKRIVPYSAKKRYRLKPLFVAMLEACRDKRAWVLDSRAAIDDSPDGDADQ